MEEEIMNQNAEQDYIDKLQELKNNSVSKEEYNKIRADNKKLLDALFSGAQLADDEAEDNEPQIDYGSEIGKLRNELYSGKGFEGTDLDYITKVLKLRDYVIATGQPDPGVSNGAKTIATEADYENCKQTCEALQEIVDYSNGDPAVFRAELMRKIKF